MRKAVDRTGVIQHKKWNKELYDHMNSGVSSIIFFSGSCYICMYICVAFEGFVLCTGGDCTL